MTSDRWLPRSQRDTDGSDYYRLRDGVPEGLQSSLRGWMAEVIEHDPWQRDEQATANSVRLIERLLDRPLADSTALLRECIADPEYFLDVIDICLQGAPAHAERLVGIMAEARALWRPVPVRDGSWRLERHISEQLDATLDKTKGRPRDYLKEAWRKQFGRTQQPDGAYRDAIRAIEAAIIPAMELTMTEPTLGKALGQLKANSGGYDIGFTPVAAFDGVMAVCNSLQLLWKSQFDRHGTPDDDVPLNVSPEESERAVVLATAYVFALQNGLLRKR